MLAVLFGFTFLLLTGCSQAQQGNGSTILGKRSKFSYNLQAPEVISLPDDVNEISGMAYGKEGHVFAVDDEKGSLFRISLQQEPVVEEWKFGRKRDFEGLVLVDKVFYLLSSDGTVVYFPAALPPQEIKEEKLSQKGRNEFEIIFKDPAASRLLLLCKSCKHDKKSEVSVFAFNIASKSFEEKPVATLREEEIEALLNEKPGRFKPSAANVHPLTGDIYIVSSINRLLVVTDGKFRVKEVHKLDENLFKQPEGLCFTPSGDLLISNEAAGQGSATILLFRRQ